jgi:hypothetical protein
MKQGYDTNSGCSIFISLHGLPYIFIKNIKQDIVRATFMSWTLFLKIG